MLDGSGVKAIPGSIPTYTQFWFIVEKNTGSQMGHTKNIYLKKRTEGLLTGLQIGKYLILRQISRQKKIWGYFCVHEGF